MYQPFATPTLQRSPKFSISFNHQSNTGTDGLTVTCGVQESKRNFLGAPGISTKNVLGGCKAFVRLKDYLGDPFLTMVALRSTWTPLDCKFLWSFSETMTKRRLINE